MKKIKQGPLAAILILLALGITGATLTNLSSIGGGWTDSGTVIYPTTATDDVAIGGTDATAPAFFNVDGTALQLNGTSLDVRGTAGKWSVDTNGLIASSGANFSVSGGSSSGGNSVSTVITQTNTGALMGVLHINKTGTGTGDVLNIDNAGTGATISIAGPASGALPVIDFASNGGTGPDIQGTADSWDVTKAGVATFTGLTCPDCVALTTATTGNYAAGDAEAGAATSGDSATAFFSTGEIADAQVADDLTLAGGTIGTSALTLVQGTAPTPTAEGVIEWETDDDHILVGDGTDAVEFVPTEDVSGDATMDAAGALTIAANSVALTTDTTGNYAAGDAEAGNATGVACSGSCIADAEVDADLTLAGATIGTSAITLVQSATPAPTAEGVIEWETDDDHILVGDGTDAVEFVPTEDVSGDVTMDTAGAVTIAANSVALTTDTTGNYAAGDGEAGNATGVACAGSCIGDAEVDNDLTIAAGSISTSTIILNVVTDTPATCTQGQIQLDPDGNTSADNDCAADTSPTLCICQATNTWYAIDMVP